MRITMGIEVIAGRRALIVAAAALWSAWVPSTAAAADPSSMLTLEQALGRAAAEGPTVRIAQGARDVAAARARQARAWDNPTLSIEVENVLGQGP